MSTTILGLGNSSMRKRGTTETQWQGAMRSKSNFTCVRTTRDNNSDILFGHVFLGATSHISAYNTSSHKTGQKNIKCTVTQKDQTYCKHRSHNRRTNKSATYTHLQTPPETGGVNMRPHVSTSCNPHIYCHKATWALGFNSQPWVFP